MRCLLFWERFTSVSLRRDLRCVGLWWFNEDLKVALPYLVDFRREVTEVVAPGVLTHFFQNVGLV